MKLAYNSFSLSLQNILSFLEDHHSDASSTSSDSDINTVVEDEEKEDDNGELGDELEELPGNLYFLLAPTPSPPSPV